MALGTNIIGSSVIIETCERLNVKRMVMISTDKAICPTSIMGATKRVAERLCLERPHKSTEFIVVRFGNVLDSSGSVIPLFKQQIKEGGPGHCHFKRCRPLFHVNSRGGRSRPAGRHNWE